MIEKLQFKKFDGTIIEDVNQYVKDFLKEFPYSEIICGCDSQQHSRYIKYAATICMHEVDKFGVGHGGHLIFATVHDYNKNIRSDIYTKLWSECELAIQAAGMIKDCGKNIIIHLDYNSKPEEYSNILSASGVGYAKSKGFEALCKPYAQISSICSDKLCR